MSDKHPESATTVAVDGLENLLKKALPRTSGHFDPVGEDRVWLLLSGMVDIFLVDRAAGGRRFHLLSRHAGQIIHGFRTPPLGYDLLAIPEAGSSLAEADWSSLRLALSDDPAGELDMLDLMDLRTTLWEGMESWILALGAVAAPSMPPAGGIRINPQSQLELPAGAIIASVAHGVAWLPATQVSWQDRSADSPEPCEHLPVFPHLWLQTETPFSGSPIPLQIWLREGSALDDLHSIQARVLSIAVSRLAERTRDDSALLQNAYQRREQTLDRTISDLTEALEGRDATTVTAESGTLIPAVQAVFRHMDVSPLFDAASQQRIAQADDPVDMLAHELGVPYRQVRLEKDWWRSFEEPLLIRHRADGSYVAVLPSQGARAAQLIEPGAGRARALTANDVERLEESAICFQVCFDTGPVLPFAAIRFLVQKARPDLLRFAFVIPALTILTVATTVLVAWLLSDVLPNRDTDNLYTVVAGLLLLSVAIAVVSMGLHGLLACVSDASSFRFATALWERVLRLPMSYFQQFTAADLSSRLMSPYEIAQRIERATDPAQVVRLTGLFGLPIILVLSPATGLALCGLTLLYVLLLLQSARQSMRAGEEAAELDGNASAQLYQLLTAVPKLRVTHTEAYAFARWAATFRNLMLWRRRQINADLQPQLIRTAYQYASYIAVVLVFVATETDGDASSLAAGAGTMGGVLFGLVLFNQALFAFADIVPQLVQATPLMMRLQPLLETPEEDSGGEELPGRLDGEVRLENVKFSYPSGREVLDGLSLTIAAGEFVALVGASGCGKSTLLRLLLGFERPDSGTIQFDGKDMTRLNKRLLRRQFGVVLQNSEEVVTGTIRQAVTAGERVTDDAVWSVLEQVGIDDMVKALPMGLDTTATSLSGGQKQRLAIARAMIVEPRFLIFDEATSALDNRSQAQVAAATERINVTRIVVAHRLSTIRNAHRICVIDDGRVVQQGRFDDLIEQDGPFRRLVEAQVT